VEDTLLLREESQGMERFGTLWNVLMFTLKIHQKTTKYAKTALNYDLRGAVVSL